MRVVAASPPSAWPASEGKPNVMEWKSAGTRNLAYWFFAGTSEFFDGLLKGLTHSTASSTDFSLPRAGTARVRGVRRVGRREENSRRKSTRSTRRGCKPAGFPDRHLTSDRVANIIELSSMPTL